MAWGAGVSSSQNTSLNQPALRAHSQVHRHNYFLGPLRAGGNLAAREPRGRGGSAERRAHARLPGQVEARPASGRPEQPGQAGSGFRAGAGSARAASHAKEKVGERAVAGSPSYPARDTAPGGRPCAGNPARSFSKPGRAVRRKALVREVGPELAVCSPVVSARSGGFRVQMISLRAGTPGQDNQPQPSIPRAACGRDAGTPGQQIPRRGEKEKGEGGAGAPPPSLGSASDQPAPLQRQPSRLQAPAFCFGPRLPHAPKVPSRGILAPPRPAQTQLLWVSVTAFLRVPVPLRSRCQLRFRAASPASRLEAPPRAMVGA
nr:collagen alpha-1(I) chain-like [Gorilla gorilla gorilla]